MQLFQIVQIGTVLIPMAIGTKFQNELSGGELNLPIFEKSSRHGSQLFFHYERYSSIF
jgi:hypothetical protein